MRSGDQLKLEIQKGNNKTSFIRYIRKYDNQASHCE